MNTSSKKHASTPRNFSQATWLRILKKTGNSIGDNNLPMLAASIAFGGTMAFFPLVAACVAIASIVIRPDQIQTIIHAMESYMPKDIASLFSTQIANAVGNTSANTWVALVAILLAVFGVSGAVNSVIGAINIAYGLKETRGIIKVRLMSMAMTTIMILGMLIIIPLVTVGKSFLAGFGVPAVVIDIFSLLRWPVLAIIVMIGLAIFYRFAPNRPRGKWQWISWGALVATTLWILGTVLFFVYVQYFAGLSNSYSLFAGIVALMIWLNFGGLIILIGAEINHQLEDGTNKTSDMSKA